MELGAQNNFKAALTSEYNLTRKFFDTVDDLATGIRAKLIDKTNDPAWNPAKYEDVQSVDAIFQDSDKTFEFHNDRDFADYPLNYALPSTLEVKQLVNKNRRVSKQEIIEHFTKQFDDKMGVKERITQIMEDHVVAVNNELRWFSSIQNNNKQ